MYIKDIKKFNLTLVNLLLLWIKYKTKKCTL